MEILVFVFILLIIGFLLFVKNNKTQQATEK